MDWIYKCEFIKEVFCWLPLKKGQMSQDNQILSDEVYQLTTVKGYNLAALNVGPTEPGNKAKLNFYAK